MATIRAALDPKTMIPVEKAECAEERSVPMAAEPKIETPVATMEEVEKATQPTNHKVNANVSETKTAAPKSPAKKLTQKSTKSATKSKVKEIQAVQQVSIEDVAIIELLESNHVKFTDNRATSGAIWLMGGHELDAVVEEASGMGVKFEFKGHWWKSV